MNIRKLIVIAALFAAAAASAQDGVVSRAYEVALDQFRAPATENGSVAFQPCADCQRMLLRVTEGTRYAVNGQRVRFEDFRRVVREAVDRERQTVTVLHHLESDTVTSLDLLVL